MANNQNANAVNENVENKNVTGVNEGMENKNTNVDSKTKVEKKVKIIIPHDPLNPKDSFVPVGINGKITQINRGVEVEVLEEIARILREAGYIA